MDNTYDVLLLAADAPLADGGSPALVPVAVRTRAEADAALASGRCAAVLSTLDDPNYPWRALLETAGSCTPPVPVILLARPDDAAGAVEALHVGAANVLVTAPGYERRVARVVRCALERQHSAALPSALAEEIRRHEETEAALRASETRLQFLLAHTPAVIFTVRVGDMPQPTFISESVHEILGYHASDFLERSEFWVDHMHPEDLERIWRTPSALYTVGKSTIEFRFLHADGAYRWLESSSLLLRNEAGAPAEIIGYLIDVTARHEAEQALLQANAELSQANAELADAARLKDEFLASMSHELRTPLHAILGRAETLDEQLHGPLNERQQRAVQRIEESGRHLLDLINDILDLSRIEAGRLELNRAPMAIEPFCQSCLQIVARTAAQKRIAVSLHVKSGLGTLLADERRMKQALVNLLANAVKFTPEDGAIGLDVARDPLTGDLRLTVWDTGIGIASDQLPRLFKPFVQLDSKLSRQYNGTGLGLVLVERMVTMHGGRVWVESEPGRGSRFIISLPWSRPELVEPPAPTAPDAAPRREDRAPRGPGGEAPLVLLADDSYDNVLVMQEYISRQGFRVATVDNGRDAVARAAELRPAIVLMDIQMPGMDGIEAIAHIRATPETAHVPIIALTGLAMPGDRERCLAAGASDYLSKPVGLRDLMRAITARLEPSQEKIPQ